MCRVYIAGQIYTLTPPYGSNWGHKIANFVFLLYISFIIAFTALECIKSIYSLHSQSDLLLAPSPPPPPIPHLMGPTGLIKNQIFTRSPEGLSGSCFHPWCPDGRAGGGKKFVRAQKP